MISAALSGAPRWPTACGPLPHASDLFRCEFALSFSFPTRRTGALGDQRPLLREIVNTRCVVRRQVLFRSVAATDGQDDDADKDADDDLEGDLDTDAQK